MAAVFEVLYLCSVMMGSSFNVHDDLKNDGTCDGCFMFVRVLHWIYPHPVAVTDEGLFSLVPDSLSSTCNVILVVTAPGGRG